MWPSDQRKRPAEVTDVRTRTEQLVDLRGVSKAFVRKGARTDALSGVDLGIRRGEFVSLLGPSGCGKSTLLRIVGGLLEADAGTVLVSGEAPARSRSEKQFALDALSDEVDAITATLHDLRDLALADADSAISRKDPVRVSEVFAEAGELVGALAEAHGLACETSIEPGLEVWGSAVRLRQLILNLGENAVKFTPPGGRIKIAASRSNGQIVASVSDTGPGIAADLLPHVFDRHVHGRNGSAQGGSGLGLAIVKRIVDAHGGKVVIQSGPGVGTTALITLPSVIDSRR